MILFPLKALLIAAVLMPQTQPGTVAGEIRHSYGPPAAGLRVALAIRRTDAGQPGPSVTFIAAGQTDFAGRYRLGNVAPGRYYVIAGTDA